MHHVRVEGRGVIARVKEVLIAANTPFRYKQKLFSFESSEDILESVLAVAKEDEAWNVHVELNLGTGSSELVASGDAVPTVSETAPVVRISLEDHAKEHGVVAVPDALPAEPTLDSAAADEAAEQARQLAELAAAAARPIETPPPVALVEAPVAEATSTLDAQLQAEADAAAAEEQARQLAEMARPAAPKAPPSTSSGVFQGLKPAVAPEPVRQVQGRTAQIWVLWPNHYAPILERELTDLAPSDSARSLYYLFSRNGNLKDRVSFVAIVRNGSVVERFPDA